MKGAFNCSVMGRLVSVALTGLVCTTILLWVWEKNPFADTLLLARQRFPIPTIGMELERGYLGSSPTFFSQTCHRTPKSSQINQPINGLCLNFLEDSSMNSSKYMSSRDIQGKNIEETSKTQTTSVQLKDMKEASETQNASNQGKDTPTTIDETKQIANSSVAPTDYAFSPTMDEHNLNATSANQSKVCNFAKGRWIPDTKRPLYSGFQCKQWLSGMWACRLTQRPDFSFEGYQWKPDSCEMPDFERSAFLRRMQDKTIAFIGDSLGRQQFQSLMCMATGGEQNLEVQNVGKEYGLVKRRRAIRPDGWAYRFPKTNTTILYYWSASLCDLVTLDSSNKTSDVAMHLDRPPAFMRQYLDRFDVLLLNTGHHWNRGKINGNRWIMYADGKPNEEFRRAPIDSAKNFTIHSVVRWLDSQLPSHPHLKIFFRTISPRHFVNGDWNTGGSCDNTTPLSGGSEVVQEGSTDAVIEAALRGTKIKILDITALSQLRDEGHISRYSIRGHPTVNDCLHWCLPGIPDTWNELLVAQI